MPFFHDQGRSSLRRMYVEAWRKHRESLPVEPVEDQIIRVVELHPEYAAALEGAGEALERDYTPEGGVASVVAFLRGLHEIDRCAQSLDPDHDALEEAVEDLSLIAATARLRETMSVSRLRGAVEAAVPVLRELADRADKLTATNSTAPTSSTTSRRSERREWTAIAGLLLMMIATVIATHGLGVAGFGGGWLQGGATGLFTALAVVVLWRTARGWRRRD